MVKLIYVDKKICISNNDSMGAEAKFPPKNIKAIMVVYQMHEEFDPYLKIEFWTNDGHSEGVIIQSKDENIRMDTKLDNIIDVETLRSKLKKLIYQDNHINIMHDYSYYPRMKVKTPEFKIFKGHDYVEPKDKPKYNLRDPWLITIIMHYINMVVLIN